MKLPENSLFSDSSPRFGNFATGNSEAFITGASYRSYIPSVFPDVQVTETSLNGIFPSGFPEVLITGSFPPNFPEKINYL